MFDKLKQIKQLNGIKRFSFAGKSRG